MADESPAPALLQEDGPACGSHGSFCFLKALLRDSLLRDSLVLGSPQPHSKLRGTSLTWLVQNAGYVTVTRVQPCLLMSESPLFPLQWASVSIENAFGCR